ncbi:MAG: hypothetical protein IKZ96_00500 [Bacilli bacterium]|nr:hypothetical protein [Bacilli bacterium]
MGLFSKKKKKEEKKVLVMIGGGDESIIIKVPKGKRILTPNGFIIAGETLEENKLRYEKRFEESIKRWDEMNKKHDKSLAKRFKPLSKNNNIKRIQ